MNIYLLHMLVIYVVTSRMVSIFELTFGNQIVIYGTTILVVLLLAHLFALYVEPKLNVLTNRIVGFLKIE